MPTVECGQIGCQWCEVTSEKYGKCEYPETITLKWRAAIDFPGKGTVLYLECLNFERLGKNREA